MLVKLILPRYQIELENTDLTHQAKPKPKRIGHHQKNILYLKILQGTKSGLKIH